MATALIHSSVAAATPHKALGSAADAERVANWVMSLQYARPGMASYGAIKTHHTSGFTAPNGDRYFRVVPYQANLGLMGLLRAPVQGKHLLAQRWISWYLSHLNVKGNPPGVVFDHWYREDGSGETTRPPGIRAALSDFDDASDSAAATLLGVVWDYHAYGGQNSFLKTAGTRAKLETVASVILALQQADGLCWAKESYRAKYLMDNAEVYWGLTAMSHLETVVFGDAPAAARYVAAAKKVRDGIFASLYNPRTKHFQVAKFEDGASPPPHADVWYPDAVAQVWPLLFGVAAPDSAAARTAMATLNQTWNGAAHPDWSRAVIDPTGFLWPSIGYAALLMGHRARSQASFAFIKQREFPRQPDEIGFATAFTVSDAGWLLMSLTSANKNDSIESTCNQCGGMTI